MADKQRDNKSNNQPSVEEEVRPKEPPRSSNETPPARDGDEKTPRRFDGQDYDKV